MLLSDLVGCHCLNHGLYLPSKKLLTPSRNEIESFSMQYMFRMRLLYYLLEIVLTVQSHSFVLQSRWLCGVLTKMTPFEAVLGCQTSTS